jgi:hypothetical protein
MIRDAVISACGQYRYYLVRIWGEGKLLVFVMLNPSTADANVDDATVRKCTGFAKALGFDGYIIVNLFALRSTDPAGLRKVDDPIGEHNDYYVREAMKRGGMTIAAWGRHGTYLERDKSFIATLPGQLHALRVNSDGTPAHPLMLPYTCRPVPYGATELQVATTSP